MTITDIFGHSFIISDIGVSEGCGCVTYSEQSHNYRTYYIFDTRIKVLANSLPELVLRGLIGHDVIISQEERESDETTYVRGSADESSARTQQTNTIRVPTDVSGNITANWSNYQNPVATDRYIDW